MTDGMFEKFVLCLACCGFPNSDVFWLSLCNRMNRKEETIDNFLLGYENHEWREGWCGYALFS